MGRGCVAKAALEAALGLESVERRTGRSSVAKYAMLVRRSWAAAAADPNPRESLRLGRTTPRGKDMIESVNRLLTGFPPGSVFA